MKNLKYLLLAFILCFISINQVSAATCNYKVSGGTSNFSISYTIFCHNGKTPLCDIIDVSDSSVKVNIITTKASFSSGCPTLYVDTNEYNAANSALSISVYEKKSDCKSNCSAITGTSVGFGGNRGDTSSTGTSEGFGGNRGDTSNTDSTDLEKTFCTGPVLGVFTTLGRIFRIIEILVPVIIITFGVIDFSKAVLASKDDEIKKSAKSLIRRVIAGVLIFFIPTIIGFIVNMIDKDKVYKGTFGDCTVCMLTPNNSKCSSLGGN